MEKCHAIGSLFSQMCPIIGYRVAQPFQLIPNSRCHMNKPAVFGVMQVGILLVLQISRHLRGMHIDSHIHYYQIMFPHCFKFVYIKY